MPLYQLQDIDARVLDRLDGNSGLFPIFDRTSDINEALRVVNLLTAFAMGQASVGNSIAGQLIYPMPAGILLPMRVYFAGKQMQKLSVRAASMRYRTWVTDQSNRGQPVQEWIPMGLRMFAIHPCDSTSGNPILVNGVIALPPLVNPTDTITIPDQHIDLVEMLAANTLQVKESSVIFSQASVLYQQVIRDIKQLMWSNSFKFPRYFSKLHDAEQKQELADAGS